MTRERQGTYSLITLVLFALIPCRVPAQISLTTAVALALNNSPRVRLAEDDLRRARAAVAETGDAYIPSLTANGGAGQSYGITLNVPTILTVNTQSLLYSAPQRFYLRASRLSLRGALLALQNVREQVEEDTASTYVSLDSLAESEGVLRAISQETSLLQTIVQKRMDAGLESQLELSQVRRQLLALKLQQLQMDDERAVLQAHLGGLTGQAASAMRTVPDTVPALDAVQPSDLMQTAVAQTPVSELSASANAEARQQHAAGDAHLAWRPQVSFAAQYGRVSPLNDVSDYYNLHGHYNVGFVGVQILLPVFDAGQRARSRQASADASHAVHDLELMKVQHEEDRLKLAHAVEELTVRMQIAAVDLSIAEVQSRSIELQIAKESDGGPILNPKDQQNARVRYRQRQLEIVDTRLQLDKARISMLRMTGGLQHWLQTGSASQPAH